MYLSAHRGEYAQRNAAFLKMVGRLDLSISQDLFGSIGGRRQTGQIRLDVTNFGNLLNSDWGVGERIVQNQILTNATTDAQGRLTYRMARVSGQLPAAPRLSTAGISDVYVMMVSFRYTFNETSRTTRDEGPAHRPLVRAPASPDGLSRVTSAV